MGSMLIYQLCFLNERSLRTDFADPHESIFVQVSVFIRG